MLKPESSNEIPCEPVPELERVLDFCAAAREVAEHVGVGGPGGLVGALKAGSPLLRLVPKGMKEVASSVPKPSPASRPLVNGSALPKSGTLDDLQITSLATSPIRNRGLSQYLLEMLQAKSQPKVLRYVHKVGNDFVVEIRTETDPTKVVIEVYHALGKDARLAGRSVALTRPAAQFTDPPGANFQDLAAVVRSLQRRPALKSVD